MIERHAGIIRRCLVAHDGTEVSTEGDSFFAVFTSASDAVTAAEEIQKSLASEEWPPGGTVAVRIGLHTGRGDLGHDNYVGLDVNRAARISAAGHGGQIVVSETVRSLEPGADYSDLGEHILKGLERLEHLYQLDVAGLAQEFPPLRTESARPNNLPTLASRILGREVEAAQLEEMLSDNRLVTITGPGGIGKTRLALEVAGDVLTGFERGAFLVDLAPINDPQLVLPEISATIGAEESDKESLAAALQDGTRLLVLDNFEQVMAAAPDLAAVMEHAAPLKVLVTSQLPLRIGSEQVFRLDPLGSSGDMSPALKLFEVRAKQADPSFDLDSQRAAVVALVDALDGVPLAIELAAARVNVLSPGQVLERLEEGYSVLKTGRADTPDRHRSITATVEWSYSLLEPDQQKLLGTLAIFRGGASMDAIEAVAERDPIDDLAELVDRSLVQTEPGTIGKRFYLLAPVQLFVEDEVADSGGLAARHADFFGGLAASAHEPLEGDSRARWLAILGDDHDNLRATLDYFLGGGDTERGYELLGDIWRFFHSTGQLDELELWLQRFFAAPQPDAPSLPRARALLARAAFFYWRAGWRESVADYEEALSIAEALNDKQLIGECLAGQAVALGNAIGAGEPIGDPAEPAQRALEIFVETGDTANIAAMELSQIMLATLLADEFTPPDPAALQRIIDLYRDAGRLMHVAHTQMIASGVDVIQGDHWEARRKLLESLETAERAGDSFTMAWVLHYLSLAIVHLGHAEMGARLAGAAEAARERLGGEWPPNPYFDDKAEELARETLGPAADEAFEAGKQMGLVQAVQLARTDIEPVPERT